MPFISRESSIDVLPLSKRASNCAHRIGVNTVGDFLDKTDEEWKNTRNLGQKTLDEILKLVECITEGTTGLILSENFDENTEDIPTESRYEINTVYISEDGRIIRDVKVEEIAPSVRAVNALKNSGYDFVSQLIGLDDEAVASIHNVGKKTINEIMDMISGLHIVVASVELNAGAVSFADELCEAFGDDPNTWRREIIATRVEYPEIRGESFIYRLYERPTIHKAAISSILKLVEAHDRIVYASLEQKMPGHLLNTTVIEDCLVELENEGKILQNESEIVRVYPSVMKFVGLIEDERNRKMLIDRFSGKTLDEIGAEHDLTRERVRQIILKNFRMMQKICGSPKFCEDKYFEFFNKYQVHEKDFSRAFNEPTSTFCYLELIDDKRFDEKLPLEAVLTDDIIPRDFRKKAENIIYKNYINDNGIRVKTDRPSLVRHFVKQYCRELTEYDEFQASYHKWLEQFETAYIENCELNSRTYMNYLANDAEYALWNYGKKIRYYNIPERDYNELLEVLDFTQYSDVVLSTAKWVREYPELMARYDIRDGFELHNLLKKLNISEKFNIDFGKMPTVTFGHGNVQNQIFDLIVECAPIDADELAQKYEDIYGVRADVLRGSPDMRAMDTYFENGMYRIDHPSMTSAQIERMTALLVDDYYTVDDVKRIFRREFPDADLGLVNTYSLKTLGFHVLTGSTGYVIKNSYQNATKYFDSLLTRDCVFDLSAIQKSIRNLVMFQVELYGFRKNYEIVEYTPMQYINIARLNEFGVTKDMLCKYCQDAAACTEVGEYFTVASLRNNGFIHELDDLGFDEWFYSSVLAENETYFSYTRLGGTRLFLRDNGKKQYACSLEGFLYSILEAKRRIDFFELADYLEEHFGIRLPKDKIKQVISESDLYYDPIMEAVYIDYDTYFEEI